ncbi:double-strand-break repair protein rad21-like protein 1 [Thamnophis elegans]|uniref:double-strand-break repair protein rad21-like protein 1 n=1 Tax=Thamnophis elegans TaxID=35005 RepID=UPI001376A544|nr:double-strand-break repair protein rad21-like protein 1 [Thamnophis elegans]
MFYMQLLMNKRGPLSKIWLAAHWDKKVTKAHIFECNLEATIEKILSPKFKIALRTSGHLLLGVVRIYHRKTKYLLTDCSEALLKMQSTFQPGLVDLPKGNSEANYDAITLPEEFYDFDSQLPDTNAIEVAEYFTLHQSKTEDITLTEFYGQNVLNSGNFDEEIEIPRHASFFSDSFINSSNSLLADHSSSNLTGDKIALEYDGFGDEGAGRDMIDDVLGTDQSGLLAIFDMEEELPLPHEDSTDNRKAEATLDPDLSASKHGTRNHQRNEQTLLCNEEDGFVLYPIVAPALLKKQRSKRKRKLLVDTVKQLSRAAMQKQLTSYEDTLATLHIAPPTRKLMVLQELGSVDKLMTRPTQPTFSEDLQRLFAKCLKTRRTKWQEKTDERSKLQTAQDLSIAESLNIQQDINYPPKESVLQSSRNERDDNTVFKTMGSLTSNLDNEEQRRSKRTLKLLNTFRHFEQQGAKSFSFLSLCKDQNKKEVAENFYSLLVLQKQRAIELAQSAPYADIIVTAGPRFRTL